ncbi:MAG: NAD-dependent epimerase/dehydratase family protein [Methanoregula sp.]
MYDGARILVAGGTGFIGVNLIRRLLSKGCKIRATLHKRPEVIHDKRIEYVQADLTRAEDCERVVQGMDYVFMCSANTSGAAVMALNPLAHVTPNVVMNAQMMEAAYRAGVKKFVFISSSAAYPPTGDRPVCEDEMFGADPYEVYYSVGWMKRYGEILCKVYAQKIKKPMAMLVIRPSNIYGPYDKFDINTSHVTTALIRKVVERQKPIEVWGSGNDVRDLIYIEDFLDGLLLAFEKSGEYLAINLASGQGYSVKEILQTIREVDGYTEAEVRFDPSKPSTIAIRLVNIQIARDILGFQPKTSLKEGLKQTVEWYRENRNVWTK